MEGKNVLTAEKVNEKTFPNDTFALFNDLSTSRDTIFEITRWRHREKDEKSSTLNNDLRGEGWKLQRYKVLMDSSKAQPPLDIEQFVCINPNLLRPQVMPALVDSRAP